MSNTTTKKEKGQKFDLKKVLFNLNSEFNKIIWPSKDSLTKSTIAVSVTSLAVGLIIAVVDMLVKYGLGLIIK